MKIYLDNNLGVEKVEQEELTQDTYGYNILKVYIPNAVLTPYDTFTCYYGALLQNGRKVGWFAMEARTSTDADYEENYTLYKATLEQCIVSVDGKVYIGCQILLGNSGNATLIKKNTAVVQFNVRKSVAINNDILVLDPDQTNTDVLESYKNLLENALTTYATKATTYTKDEVNSALALKADKSDSYTKQEVNEVALGIMSDVDLIRGQVVNLSDTTGQLETDVENLKSVQNVVEVVATKSALNSYDTTKLDIDDKVQVIADETHSGASTIYNWNGSAWVYVGAFGGNSYTKAETYNKTQIDSALSDKADKSNTYTRTVIDSMILTLSTDKADKSDTYTRAVVDSFVLTLSTEKADKSTTYTKTEIDGKFEEIGPMFEILENEVLKKADKTELDNAINDLRWELGSHTLDVTTDSDTSFSKSVPSGAIGCQINKIGGMSYKVNDTIQHSAVTSVVSKGSSNNTIDNLTIPTAIQNLTGYGWGINDTCYNYIDFESKKFIENVGKLLGSTYENNIITATTSRGLICVAIQTDIDLISSNETLPIILNNLGLVPITARSQWATTDVNVIALNMQKRILINFDQSLTESEMIEKAKNLVLYFKLLTPIETDISAYITTDTIDVEPNGTLEFTNTYSQDVPSDIDYLIEEVKA